MEFGLSDPICFWWEEYNISFEILRKIIQNLELECGVGARIFWQSRIGALFNQQDLIPKENISLFKLAVYYLIRTQTL